MVKHKDYSKWSKVAKDNGISPSTFHARVKELGWDMEEAATIKQKGFSHKKYTDLADKNNVPRGTYYNRFHNGWDPYKAATTPVRHKRKSKKKDKKVNESSSILNSMITTDDVKEYINIKPKLSRKEALEKIHVLERQKLYATKEECKEIDKKILELGKNLVIPRRQRKLRRIISKGKYMTANDIRYLKVQGLSNEAIYKFMNISKKRFYERVRGLLGDAV